MPTMAALSLEHGVHLRTVASQWCLEERGASTSIVYSPFAQGRYEYFICVHTVCVGGVGLCDVCEREWE